MSLLFLGESEVRELFTVSDAMAAARRAFAALGTDSVTMPQRLAVSVPEHQGTHLSMPCYLNDAEGEVLTVKVATVFEGNRKAGLPTTQAHLILHDPTNGALLAVIEAEHLTAMRTAAASALATSYLARPNVTTLGIFGTGGQAQAHLEVLTSEIPTLRRVFVSARSDEGALDFCQLNARLGLEFVPRSNVEACDILCLATSSIETLFDGRSLAPGTHVNAVGAFRPDMRELDAVAIRRCRVFVDLRQAAERGAGDLIQAGDEGSWSWQDLCGDLPDLALGRVFGRQSDDEITLFKSVGLAVQDAAAAQLIYARALER